MEEKILTILLDIQKDVKELKERVTSLEEKVDRLEKRIDSLEEKVDILEKRVDNLEEGVECLKGQRHIDSINIAKILEYQIQMVKHY